MFHLCCFYTMNAEEILKCHNLKNTSCRKLILNELINSQSALSENDIKQSLPDLFDRVTFYRAIRTLEENCIIHRILLSDGTIKYALSKSNFLETNHSHFQCLKCKNVLCLETSMQTNVELPLNFTLRSVRILLEGICPTCKEK